MTVYLERVPVWRLRIKPVFTNEEGTTGRLYRVTSATTLAGEGLATLYQKRWNVEPDPKALKQKASLEQSPTPTVPTQANHLLAARWGFLKLELLKSSTQRNHLALKSRLH